MTTFPTYGGATGSSSGSLSFPTYGSNQDDLSTSQGLYQLAQQHGGAVAQAANEIMHPTTGILSSIGSGLKNAFRGFVNTISVPSEVVAGIISPDLTIGQAVSQHVTPSDVIFGAKNPNASIYQKVGSFLVRTATDVLLDPLTYVTFGAGEGLLGLRTGTEVALGENALAQIGRKPLLDAAGNIVREANTTGTLNKTGDEVYQYLSKLSRQMNGTASAEIVKTGNPLLDLAGDELKAVTKATIDSPLSPDFAKKALTNLLEHNPAYAVDLLDKGGIKVFGKSILSGQRISSTLKMVPGMTALDLVTVQPRMAISALFNPTIVKDSTGRFVRLPQEYVDLVQKWGDFAKAHGEEKLQSLENIRKEFDLKETESRFLTASIENARIPANERLANAFKAALGFNEKEWQQLVDSGMISKEARLDSHIPHILVKNKLGVTAFRMPPSTATGATELRQIAKYTDIKTGQEITGHAGSMGLSPVKEGENAGLFTNKAGDLFRREVAPIHNATEEQLAALEGTLLKDPKAAAKMLDDMKAQGLQGFNDNAITALAARSLKNTKAVSMKYFLRELAENFGHDASLTEGSGFTRISSSGVKDAGEEIMPFWSKDGELLYHPAIAAHVENFMGSLLNDDATMSFLKSYDNLQNIWKATVTSIWPAFHGRNALSNVLQNFLDLGVGALDPRVNTMSVQIINADRQLAKLERAALDTGEKGTKAKADMANTLQKVLFTDRTGHDWTYGELRQVIKNNQIAFTRTSKVTSADVSESVESATKALFPNNTLFGKATNLAKKPFKFGQDTIGGTIEDHARLVNFISNLKNTGDVTLASRRTKQFLFDYSNLTNFEKLFMKRLIPFYTFCLPDTTEILTKTGWKLCDDLAVGEEVLTYNADRDCYEWQTADEVNIFDYDNELTSLSNSRHELLFTPDHRWVVQTPAMRVSRPYGEYQYPAKTEIKRGYELNTSHSIKIVSELAPGGDSILTPEQASLLGWLLTDGYWRWKGNHCEAMIYQSPKKWTYRFAVQAAGDREPTRFHPDSGVACMSVKKELLAPLLPYLHRKKNIDNWIDVVTGLSREAAIAMYHAMYMGDGTVSMSRTSDFLACQLRGVGETFQVLATLLGKRVVQNGSGYCVSDAQLMKVAGMQSKTVHYTGRVWCPTTKNGTWVARQGKLVTITGNTRKNLELQVRSLLKTPGRIAAEVHGVNTLGEVISGGNQLTDDEWNALPDWVKSGIGILTKKNGDQVTLITSLGTPLEQPFQALQANVLLGSVSPLIRLPVEQLSGYSFFEGKPLSEVTNAAAFVHAPKFLQDLIGFTKLDGQKSDGTPFTWYVSLHPEMMNLFLNLPPTTRVFSAMKQMQAADVADQAKIFQQLTGVRPYSFDLEHERQKREDETVTELQDLLTKAGVTAQFSRTFIPKAKKNQIMSLQ